MYVEFYLVINANFVIIKQVEKETLKDMFSEIIKDDQSKNHKRFRRYFSFYTRIYIHFHNTAWYFYNLNKSKICPEIFISDYILFIELILILITLMEFLF